MTTIDPTLEERIRAIEGDLSNLNGHGPQSDDLLRRWSAAELARADLTVQWIVRGVLMAPSYGMVAGQMKTLKTHLTALLVVSIASGRPFLDHFPVDQPGPVCIYVGEGGRIPYTRLLNRVCEAAGVTLAALPIEIVFEPAPVSSDLFQETLARDLEEVRPKLVLVDPWYAYHGAQTDAKNLFEEGALLSKLQAQVAKGGSNLIIVNHFNQTGAGADLKRITMVGGGEWVDSWMLLTHRVEPDVNHGEFKLGLQIGSRVWGGSTWELDMHTGVFDQEAGHHDGPLTWDLRRSIAVARVEEQEHDVWTRRILEEAEDDPDGVTKERLVEAAGIGKEKARRLVNQLLERQLIERRMVTMTRKDDKPQSVWRYFRVGTEPAPGPNDQMEPRAEAEPTIQAAPADEAEAGEGCLDL